MASLLLRFLNLHAIWVYLHHGEAGRGRGVTEDVKTARGICSSYPTLFRPHSPIAPCHLKDFGGDAGHSTGRDILNPPPPHSGGCRQWGRNPTFTVNVTKYLFTKEVCAHILPTVYFCVYVDSPHFPGALFHYSSSRMPAQTTRLSALLANAVDFHIHGLSAGTTFPSCIWPKVSCTTGIASAVIDPSFRQHQHD